MENYRTEARITYTDGFVTDWSPVLPGPPLTIIPEMKSIEYRDTPDDADHSFYKMMTALLGLEG